MNYKEDEAENLSEMDREHEHNGEISNEDDVLSVTEVESNNITHSESDSDDDYYLSDEEELNNLLSSPNDNQNRVNYATSMSDHVAYFTNALSHTLESILLDKSLVLQAQLSGQLNNEKQKLVDKNKEVLEKIESIRNLHAYNFNPHYDHSTKTNISKVEKLRHDITEIESRLEKLKNGVSKGNSSTLGTFFKSKKHRIGVSNKYPVEYNQSKDKVLERQIDE